MLDNYPPGAANDPNAPWNQKDPEMTEWEMAGVGTCCCCESEDVEIDEEFTCEECFVAEEIEDDPYEDDDGGRE